MVSPVERRGNPPPHPPVLGDGAPRVRFCLGVEHGDYNGTELFGVGTDRFLWLAYKPNGTPEIRILSLNVPDRTPCLPPPLSAV